MIKQNNINGLLWITGLSGSGKTTLAQLVEAKLIDKNICRPIMLDGDTIRNALHLEKKHGPKDRKELASFYSAFCSILTSQKYCVICSTISMFEEIRALNRQHNDNYYEVFLDVNDDTRIARRDLKSLSKADILCRDTIFQFPSSSNDTLKNASLAEMDLCADKIVRVIADQWMA